jgi:hypothetical protein
VQRLLAIALVLAFVAATAPIAACGRGPERECCCARARANALCAPDCCDTVKRAPPLVNVAAHLRGFSALAQPLSLPIADFALGSAPLSFPTAPWFVGLHTRASPRLPLRV